MPTSVEAASTAVTGPVAGSQQPPDGREVMRAFANAAVTSVRQWRYESPVQAPIVFWVEVTFRPGRQAMVTQNTTSRGVWGATTRAGFGAAPPPPPPPPPSGPETRVIVTTNETVSDSTGNARTVPARRYANFVRAVDIAAMQAKLAELHA